MRQPIAFTFPCVVVSLLSALAIAGCDSEKPHGSATATPAAPASTIESDVAHLKDVVPAQSHTMIDVGYHMSNLWFAAEKQNWDLAAFEVDETRNRIRWTLRLSTTRKLPDGSVLDMKPLFDGIDKSVLTPLKEAVGTKDMKTFVPAYRSMLEACYQCHKAAGKAYLRPMVPTVPPQTIINYDPKADWPQ